MLHLPHFSWAPAPSNETCYLEWVHAVTFFSRLLVECNCCHQRNDFQYDTDHHNQEHGKQGTTRYQTTARLCWRLRIGWWLLQWITAVAPVTFVEWQLAVEQWNRNTAGIVRATILPNTVAAAIVVSVSGLLLSVASTVRNRGSRLGSNGSYNGSLHHHCQFSSSTRPFGLYFTLRTDSTTLM